MTEPKTGVKQTDSALDDQDLEEVFGGNTDSSSTDTGGPTGNVTTDLSSTDDSTSSTAVGGTVT